jgi:Mrp family chromosome partitioning ATPase
MTRPADANDLDVALGPTPWTALRRHIPLWIAVSVLGAVIGAAVAFVMPVQRVTNTELLLKDPREVPFRQVGALPGDFARELERATELADSADVIDPAADTLGVDNARLRAAVSASTITNGIKIKVSGSNASEVRDWAPAVVASFRAARTARIEAQATVDVTALEEQEVKLQAELENFQDLLDNGSGTAQQDIRDTRDLITATREAINQVQVNATSLAENDGVVLEKPSARGVFDVRQSPLQGAAAGGALAAVLCGLILWARVARQRPLLVRRAAEGVIAAPFLGAFGEIEVAKGANPTLPAPETATSCTAVQLVHGSGPIAVVGSTAGEGASLFALSYAAASARAGRRTMLIDASDDKRGIAARVGAPSLTASTNIDAAKRTLRFGKGEIDVLSVTEAYAETASNGSGVEGIITRLADDYDAIVIDAELGDGHTVTPALAAAAGRALAVVRSGTSANDVERLDSAMAGLGVNMIGYVFNEFPRDHRS